MIGTTANANDVARTGITIGTKTVRVSIVAIQTYVMAITMIIPAHIKMKIVVDVGNTHQAPALIIAKSANKWLQYKP